MLLLAGTIAGALPGCGGERGGQRGEGCDAAGNPLDAELCREFRAVGYEPVEAPGVELCTRAWIDLLGVRPSARELEDRCLGRDFADVVRALQRTPEYRDAQRRRWADRFRYSEYHADVRSIRELDTLVDDLYRRRIGYREFAVEAMSGPAFAGRFIGYGQPDQVSQAAFRAFLGRSATRPEALDVGNLWRPWAGGFIVEDGPAFAGDPVPTWGPTPYIDPYACEAGVRECRSTILGEAVVSFPRRGRDAWLTWDQLTEEDRDALRVPGRHLSSLPMFWEAAVDEVIERYLGYDLGARLPGARQTLVRWFQASGGDLVRLERVVLTSWAYRQSAFEDPARPRPAALRFQGFAWGPTKPMLAEAWLASVARAVGRDAGDCDWRYPNLPDWYWPDPLLDELLADTRYERRADGTFDPWFRDTAGRMGGCPGSFDYASYTTRTRSTHVGLLASVAQEEALVELCLVGNVPGLIPRDVDAASTARPARERTVRHVLARLAAEPPADEDVAEVLEAAESCRACTAESIARELCAALAGGVEWVFY